MENAAPQSGMPPKSPNSRKKIALLSLGTCVLLGIVGVEAFLENNDRNTPFHSQNFSLTSASSQNEQLQVELNHANQNLNQLKRQLFVRNSAPVSAFNRKLQDDFAQKEKAIQELAEAIKTHEFQLNNEKAKVATLESSLAALADLIEIQKNSKERFHDTLRLTVESKEDESEKHKESLAQANEEIDSLKARIANELAEKQTLVEALEIHAALHQETNKHLATLNDEIAIERTVQTLASQNIKDEHQESISSLRLELDKLQSLLESTQVKLENESSIKENTNQTVLALVNKSCLLEAELTMLNEKQEQLESTRAEELKTLGERGAELEDEIAFATTARAIETSRLAQNHSDEIEAFEKNYREICATCKELENGYADLQLQAEELKNKNYSRLSDTLSDKSDVEQTLLFAQLESKLAQERLTIELEDISYALIAAEHQRDLMKRNLEDHLIVFNEERDENALKISQLDAELHAERLEKQQLLSQLAEIHLVKETDAGFTADLSQEVERSYAYQNSLKDQIINHQALVSEKQAAWETAVNQHKLELASLEEKHNEVQSNLENEKNRALELKETTDHLSRAISETEEALKAANIAFQMLEQESTEKISALQETLNSKENAYAEVSEHRTQIEQQTLSLEQAKEQQHAYITELERALKNAEAGLHQAASALELFDEEISTKTVSLNEHIERKEALEVELNLHKDALSRSTEVEQNLKQELGIVLMEANALSIHITTLENALKQKEQSISESQDLDSQTKEEQEARIAHLESALEDARLALENDVRELKEQHIHEISLASNMHSQAQESEWNLKQEAQLLSQKIIILEDELKQKVDAQGSTEERIAHLQQTLKETEESLSSNIRALEEEHDKKVSELHSQKEDLESRLKQELEKALAESEALSHELKQKEEAQGSTEERIAHLQQTLEETKESLSSNIRALEEEHERKVSELASKNQEILAISDTLSHELKQKEIQESSFKHELEQSRTRTEALDHELKQRENDKDAIQETIEQHEARIALLQEQHQQKVLELHSQKEQALANTESLSNELKEKEEAHEAAKESVELYEAHFAELEQALEEVKESLVNTVQQLKNNHSREIALLGETIQQKDSTHTATIESEKQQREHIEIELRNLATSKEHLAEKYNEAIQSIEQLQQEINAKEGTIQVNAEQVNHLKMEVDHVQKALIHEKKQSEDLLLQLETIKNQYQKAQSSLEENAAIEAKLQSLSDALEDQADELNQLKSVKDALENEIKEANAQKEEPLEII